MFYYFSGENISAEVNDFTDVFKTNYWCWESHIDILSFQPNLTNRSLGARWVFIFKNILQDIDRVHSFADMK